MVSVLSVLADKGYDADQRVIERLQQQVRTAVISSKRNRKTALENDRERYKTRHLIENFFAKLKQYRAIANAEVAFYERRYYLQSWCDEVNEKADLPELRHNRYLRLDRIQAIFPISGEGHGRFDTVQVQLAFTGELIKAYEPKDGDIHDEVENGVRRVTRTVINPFWLIREVRRYGSDCVILSPAAVRDRFKQELLAMVEKYSS